MKRKSKEDLLLEKRINVTYLEFKQFIKEEKLPSLNIKIVPDTKENPLTYKSRVDLECNPTVLYINSRCKYDENLGSILYHEFTHIYDYYIFGDMNNKKQKIQYYTEYHASQIEMIKKYKIVESIDENFNKEMLINTGIAKKLADESISLAKSFVNKVGISIKEQSKFNLKTAYFYHCGVNDLVNYICEFDDSTPVNFLEDKKKDYMEIHRCLQPIKYNERPSDEIIEKIYKLY